MKLPALLLAGSPAANASLLLAYCGRGAHTPLPAPAAASTTPSSQPALLAAQATAELKAALSPAGFTAYTENNSGRWLKKLPTPPVPTKG